MASQGATSAVLPNIAVDESATRVYGGYKADNYSVGASYEIVNVSATAESTYLYITGTYSVDDSTDLVASVGIVDEDVSLAEGTGMTLAVFREVATNTKAFALYSQVSTDVVGNEDPSTLSIGVQHNFSLSN